MKDSVDVYEAHPLDKQLGMLLSELKPIAGKCMGITGFIMTVVGKPAYYRTLHHGVGGGQIGNKMNKAKQLAIQNHAAEVYWTGHIHTAATFPSVQKTLDKKRNSRTKHTARHIITGHFLKYDESCAEDYMLEEAPIAVAQVKLHPSGNVKISHKLIEADQSSSLPKSRINLLEAVCGPNSHAQPLPYTPNGTFSPYRANLNR